MFPIFCFSDLVKNSDLMWRQSVWSSTIAASIAANHLKDGGLISLPGAKPALGATPGKYMCSIFPMLNFIPHSFTYSFYSCSCSFAYSPSSHPFAPPLSHPQTSFLSSYPSLVSLSHYACPSPLQGVVVIGMIGYGMAKAAIHQLTKSLAADNSGLPPNCLAVAILPITLDTPMNRKWMPNADYATWTPLEFVADLFLRWTRGEDRPASGSLVNLVTKNYTTEQVLV
uniref:Dihydropteridine reductase n=1 Tax=Timema monikensis TaxID=170555 RepID=A0A7R9EAD0_9NEOP|nr:unnamed protein product [Timema monikensis]